MNFKLLFCAAICNSTHHYFKFELLKLNSILVDYPLDNMEHGFLRKGHLSKRQLFPSERLPDLDLDATPHERRSNTQRQETSTFTERTPIEAAHLSEEATLIEQSDVTPLQTNTDQIPIVTPILDRENIDQSQHRYQEHVFTFFQIVIMTSAPISIFCCMCCMTKCLPRWIADTPSINPTMHPTSEETLRFTEAVTRNTYTYYRSLEESFTLFQHDNLETPQNQSQFNPYQRDEHGYIPNAPTY